MSSAGRVKAAAATAAAGVAAAASLICAPAALANEDSYLDDLFFFADFEFGEADEARLIELGRTACEERALGIGKLFSVNFMRVGNEEWLTREDAEVIYDSAMAYLC